MSDWDDNTKKIYIYKQGNFINNIEFEIDKVTTPGGWTIKGLNAMEEYGFTNAVIKGIKANN